jgi:hypothetical protein
LNLNAFQNRQWNIHLEEQDPLEATSYTEGSALLIVEWNGSEGSNFVVVVVVVVVVVDDDDDVWFLGLG